MRGMRWVCVLLVIALSGLGSVALAAEGAVPPVDALVYQGATVKTQVDVNGLAAVQLVGAALDAAVAQAQQQAKAMQAAPPSSGANMMGPQGPMAMMAAALPMLEPAKDVIKSLDHITVLDMQPNGAVDSGAFVKYYSDLMSQQGWSPLLTVRDQGGTAVVAMTAPEAKGVFIAVNDKSELIAAAITTTKPIGDLMAQLIQASGDALPTIMAQMNHPQPQPQVQPQPQPKPKAKPHHRKTTKK